MATSDFIVKNGLVVNQNLDVKGTTQFTNAVTAIGDLSVQGSTTIGNQTTDTFTVNTSALATSATTFSLASSAATTELNVGTSATTVSIGAGTGTTTINNASTVVTGDLTVTGGDIVTAVGTASNLYATTTTGNIGLASGLTSGTLTVGGSSATGTISIDPSTVAHTLNIGTGANASGVTKTVNLGTGGAAGSTSNINIGSANGGTTTVSSPEFVVSGNLTVNGTTTNINTTNLVVEDKNIVLGDVATPSDTTADGGGITLLGTSSKTLVWVDSTDSWTSNQNFAAPSYTLNAATGNFTFADSGTTKRGVIGTVGTNDQWFVGGGATAADGGFLEISTGDNGTEPIYVRQYNSTPIVGTLARELILLDASGNTTLPGDLTVTGGDIVTAAGTASNLYATTTTGNVGLATGLTSGTLTVGGTSATGTVSIDPSTLAHTLNIGTGANASGVTKTVNLGTGGAAGSTTNINIGSTTGGTLTLNNPTVSFPNTTGTAPFTVASTTVVTNLNADLLDGINSGSFLRSDVSTTWSATNGPLIATTPAGSAGSNTGQVNTLQVFQATSGSDAFMTFHISGDYAAHFGLDGTTNDLFYGGWSVGSVKNKVWHAGNDGTGSGLDADLLDGIDSTGFVYRDEVKSFGTIAVQAVAGSSVSCTTAQFISWLETQGFFDYVHSYAKCSWDYAGNNDISDTGFGANFELAGCVIETWTDNSDDVTRGNITVRITAPTTGGNGGGKILIYNDQGVGYSPGWRQIWTNTTDGSGSGLDADLLDGLELHTGRNNETNKVVRTDTNGYLQVGYINSSSGNEANNSNPPRVWGTNGSDDYLRTYLTSALSVNYANSAGSTPYPVFSSDSVDKDNITTRTETGFYQSSTGTLAEGWPTDSNGWHHLISCTHSNDANYYALQLSSTFFDQNLYFRATNGSGTTGWSKVWTSSDSTITMTGLTTGATLTSGTVTGQWTLGSGSTWQATFADLAEWYTSDVDYEAGTVVVFGGDAETTISTTANDRKVAGVVSTNPAFIMNVDQPGPSACVALQGKVPVKVIGQVAKGDLLVTSNVAGVAMVNNDAGPYTVIGKALENKTTLEQGVVYVSVGR